MKQFYTTVVFQPKWCSWANLGFLHSF